MDQISFFPDGPSFPLTYDDLQRLYEQFVYEGEKDDDVFTWSEIKEGRSYYMYGKKVLEFIPGDEKKARLSIFPLNTNGKKRILKMYDSSDTLLSMLQDLKQIKKPFSEIRLLKSLPAAMISWLAPIKCIASTRMIVSIMAVCTVLIWKLAKSSMALIGISERGVVFVYSGI